MKRKTDVRAIEAALKKAGKDALTGPRELRSGRYVARDSTSGRFVDAKPAARSKAQPKK